MKIALLTDGLYPYVIGGMQKHSYVFAKNLLKHKVNVVLFHCVYGDDHVVKDLDGFSDEELDLLEHKCFNFPKLDSFPGHYLRESFKLSKIYKEELKNYKDIDLVYSQGFTAWALLKVIPKNRLYPIIVNFHGLNMFQKASSIKSKLEHLLFRPAVKFNLLQADYVISLGGKLTKILSQFIDDDKIIIIPIGVEKEWLEQNPKNNHPRKLVFIGRDERVKGIMELNKVIKKIKDLKFELHIIGPFNQKDRLKLDSVIYYGEIKKEEEICRLLSQMDVLIVPSWSEGMPTVIIEAMAKSCVVIGTDVGAVRELVDDSIGWLIEAGDVLALEKSIRKAISVSDNELEIMKNAAYNKVKDRFISSSQIESTVIYFRKIISIYNSSNINT